MTRFTWNDYEDDSNPNDSCNEESGTENDLVYSDDDDDDNDENDTHDRYVTSSTSTNIPRPITKSRMEPSGRTRYRLKLDDDDDNDFDNNLITSTVQQYPPLESYRDSKTASISHLLSLSMRSRVSSTSKSISHQPLLLQQSNIDHNNRSVVPTVTKSNTDSSYDDDIVRLAQLLQQLRTSDPIYHTNNNDDIAVRKYRTTKKQYDQQKEKQQIQSEMQKLYTHFQQQHDTAQQALQQLINQTESKAKEIKNAILLQQQQQEENDAIEEQHRYEQQKQQQQQRQEIAEEVIHNQKQSEEQKGSDTSKLITKEDFTKESESKTAVESEKHISTEGEVVINNNKDNNVGQRERKQSPVKPSPSRPSSSSSPARSSSSSSDDEYIVRAEKYRSQLIELEKSVIEYDTSNDPMMKQRRLQYKKLVNGKINTLAENVQKIQQVAQDVIQAIITAKNEDTQWKSQSSSSTTNQNNNLYGLGKRYLVNLLSSKVIVRIQAEGFNGQRGDGFPLAHMLSIVAANVKDIIPVLTAHIYTVCPTAIPTLPSSSSSSSSTKNNSDSDEDDFMKQLGMIRQKDGNFESFERFLSRTEGIISLVANIMASEPSDHTLLGGNLGAVKWLKRFLSILPPKPQAPLPLITAPVLDAFLTGAGHMMANIHTELFQKFLDVITNDICTRLDESSIGMPSATRLRKTIRNGIDGFRLTLPSRALPELYYGANGKNNNQTGPTSAFNSTPNATPFGASGSGMTAHSPSPFGINSSQQTQVKPLFGNNSSSVQTSSSNTFNSAPTQSSSSPFGSSTTQSPFGMSMYTTTSTSSPFSTGLGTTTAPNQSPFQATNSNTMPFGNNQTPSQQSTPFGSPPPTSNFGAQQTSPFGGGTTSANSPFGSAPSSSTSPFGDNTTSSTPFGSSSTTSTFPTSNTFGNQQQSPFTSNTPTGFASSSSSSSLFGMNSAPFGGGGAPAPANPFGSGGTSSIFGASTTSTSITPFGGSMTSNTPFGSSQSPFGSANLAPSPTPFSSNSQQPYGVNSNFNQQSQSTFGGGQANNSAFPFSGQSQQQQSTPFGSSQGGGSVFGLGQSGGNSGAADSRPPCKFFARGQCTRGASCNFSHTNTSGGQYTNTSNLFGGPRR